MTISLGKTATRFSNIMDESEYHRVFGVWHARPKLSVCCLFFMLSALAVSLLDYLENRVQSKPTKMKRKGESVAKQETSSQRAKKRVEELKMCCNCK